MRKKLFLATGCLVMALAVTGCGEVLDGDGMENTTDTQTEVTSEATTEVTTEATTEVTTQATTMATVAPTVAPTQLQTVAPTQPVATVPSELLNTEPITPKKSGNAELDGLVEQLLAEITNPTMSKYSQVVACYEFFLNNISYTGGMHATPGKFAESDAETTPKEILWAIDILSARKGNCYNFAAGFMYLMRAIGYDAHLVSGTTVNTQGQYTEHCWMYVNLGGKAYSFDPDIDMDRKQRGQGYAYFCREMDYMLKYNYKATTYYEN